MDVNEYVLEMLVREKLAEARAARACRDRAARARPPRPPWRARAGAVLIALGQRLAGAPAAASANHG